MKRAYIKTFGCQMNVYDSERMAEHLGRAGYTATDDPADADVIVLNTCAVREKAEQKVLSDLGRLRPLKEDRDTLLVVAGCVAQQEGQALLRKVPYLDLVIGPDQLGELPALLGEVQEKRRRVAKTELYDGHDYVFPASGEAYLPGGPTAFVTVMKGCDKMCSFCIVPYVRGRELSRPSEDILAEVARLVAAGVKEVTLVGQNVNSYGKQGRVEIPFAELLRRVAAVDGVQRVRYTTSYPRDFTEDLIQAMAEVEEVCEHVHLPVQSGSDAVLHHMRRRHTAADYLAKIDALRKAVPDAFVSTDFIVGYPTETEADFEATLDLMRTVRFDAAFAFAYSPRPYTRASELPDAVPNQVKAERLQRLLELQSGITRASLERQVGQTVEVLVEGPSKTDGNKSFGRTRGNVIVNFEGPTCKGAMEHVLVERAFGHSLAGRVARTSRLPVLEQGAC